MNTSTETPGYWNNLARIFKAGQLQVDGWQDPAAKALYSVLGAMEHECKKIAGEGGQS